MEALSRAVGERPPVLPPLRLEKGEAVIWDRALPGTFQRFTVEPPRERHRRHRRKYAEGELIEEEHFVFRGPEQKLNLAAENLRTFVKIAEGVDEDTWLHHLRRGEYSRWFREAIKDKQLADEAAAVEHEGMSAKDSRQRIKAAIQARYAV